LCVGYIVLKPQWLSCTYTPALFSKLCHLRIKFVTQFTVTTDQGENEIKVAKGLKKGRNGARNEDMKEIILRGIQVDFSTAVKT
jgi:hypothetical protein